MNRSPLLVAALALLAASPAVAGPPWIAIEYPATPLHPSTRRRLLVRATIATAIAMLRAQPRES
jgi:hypothetical protein